MSPDGWGEHLIQPPSIRGLKVMFRKHSSIPGGKMPRDINTQFCIISSTETEALSNLRWLPLLHETELAALSSEVNLFVKVVAWNLGRALQLKCGASYALGRSCRMLPHDSSL